MGLGGVEFFAEVGDDGVAGGVGLAVEFDALCGSQGRRLEVRRSLARLTVFGRFG